MIVGWPGPVSEKGFPRWAEGQLANRNSRSMSESASIDSLSSAILGDRCTFQRSTESYCIETTLEEMTLWNSRMTFSDWDNHGPGLSPGCIPRRSGLLRRHLACERANYSSTEAHESIITQLWGSSIKTNNDRRPNLHSRRRRTSIE